MSIEVGDQYFVNAVDPSIPEDVKDYCADEELPYLKVIIHQILKMASGIRVRVRHHEFVFEVPSTALRKILYVVLYQDPDRVYTAGVFQSLYNAGKFISTSENISDQFELTYHKIIDDNEFDAGNDRFYRIEEKPLLD